MSFSNPIEKRLSQPDLNRDTKRPNYKRSPPSSQSQSGERGGGGSNRPNPTNSHYSTATDNTVIEESPIFMISPSKSTGLIPNSIQSFHNERFYFFFLLYFRVANADGSSWFIFFFFVPWCTPIKKILKEKFLGTFEKFF